MRKRVVIPVFALAFLFLIGAYYLHHRNSMSGQLARLAQSRVIPPAPAALPPMKVVPASRSVRPQTEMVIAESRQNDVTLPILHTIIDLNADILKRQRAIRALPKDLIPEHRKLLTEFLTTSHQEDDGQFGQVLKNDIMNMLVGQKTPARALAETFIGIYRDSSQNPVIRDYAVQHLSLLSERLDKPTVWETSQIRAQQKLIQDTLWQIAEARESSTAGTALLGLTRISSMHEDVDKARLGEVALKMTASGTDEAARVTAFQVCARLNVFDTLSLAVETAQTDSSTIVRVSAIGALGLIGSAKEVPVLAKIAEQNTRLKTVALMAMRKIQDKTR